MTDTENLIPDTPLPETSSGEEVVDGVNPDPNRYPGHPIGHKCPACSKTRKLGRGEQVKPRSPVENKATSAKANKVKWANKVGFGPAVTPGTPYDWEKTSLPEAELHLAWLRKEMEAGARVLASRYNDSHSPTVPCAVCNTDIPNFPKAGWRQCKTIRDANTGLLRSIYFCSQRCIAEYTRNPANLPTTGNKEITGLPKPEPPVAVQQALAKRGN